MPCRKSYVGIRKINTAAHQLPLITNKSTNHGTPLPGNKGDACYRQGREALRTAGFGWMRWCNGQCCWWGGRPRDGQRGGRGSRIVDRIIDRTANDDAPVAEMTVGLSYLRRGGQQRRLWASRPRVLYQGRQAKGKGWGSEGCRFCCGSRAEWAKMWGGEGG